MKIAIYGDSFGCINLVNGSPDIGTSWPELLMKNNSVKIFARTGSAFMFSYEEFLNNHAEYDLNIFIPTLPNRLYVKALPNQLFFGSTWAEYLIKLTKKKPWYAKKEEELDILESVKIYIELWADFEMMRHIQHVLVNNLWNLSPNTLVIPGFADSISQTTKNLHELAMAELKLADQKKFNEFDFNFMSCKRKCHFSEENNLVIFELLSDAIKNNKKILEIDNTVLVTPSKNFDDYVGKAVLE
jgi:hypothetical protein